MTYFHAIILALVQGLTEFLPISSSAHLILTSQLLGWQDQGLAFDVAVHVGTLLAVVSYYWRTLLAIIGDWFGSLAGKGVTANSRLGWAIILGTIPLGLLGLAFNTFSIVDLYLREIWVIATTTLVFGLLLGYADKCGSRERQLAGFNWRDILVIGGAQALALIPGTSRSGITITAAMLLGFKRKDAANYSFLLSIPAIALPGGLKSAELVQSDVAIDWSILATGVGVAAVSAFVCIHLFLKWIEKMGMQIFVWYRVLLALILFAIYFGVVS